MFAIKDDLRDNRVQQRVMPESYEEVGVVKARPKSSGSMGSRLAIARSTMSGSRSPITAAPVTPRWRSSAPGFPVCGSRHCLDSLPLPRRRRPHDDVPRPLRHVVLEAVGQAAPLSRDRGLRLPPVPALHVLPESVRVPQPPRHRLRKLRRATDGRAGNAHSPRSAGAHSGTSSRASAAGSSPRPERSPYAPRATSTASYSCFVPSGSVTSMNSIRSFFGLTVSSR